jgi:alpha-tubulin suppressor-like RCC1 family protein
VSLAAGGGHSCAVDAAGAVACWGLNGAGQLGLRRRRAQATPELLRIVSAVVQIDAGTYFSCALGHDGVLRCWGEIGLNGLPRQAGAAIEVLRDVKSFALGADHGCAVTTAGQVRCFGSNVRGQLGVGRVGPVEQPAPAVTGLAEVREVSCGAAHSCALTMTGRVSCWGFNATGQLGEGTREDRSVPATDLGLADVVRIESGAEHGCALTRAGAVYCWGRNDSGQLGLGDTADRLQPARLALDGTADQAAELALGANHTCVRTRAAQARCWGLGEGGRLGYGDEADRAAPGAPLDLPAVWALAAGDMHSCALTAAGPRCWGVNDGQLGDGSFETRLLPVAVVWPPAASGAAKR